MKRVIGILGLMVFAVSVVFAGGQGESAGGGSLEEMEPLSASRMS
jgi:hypothetical protein